MNPRVCWFCRIALFTIQSCFTENSSFCIIFRTSLSVGDSDVQMAEMYSKNHKAHQLMTSMQTNGEHMKPLRINQI